MTDRDGLKRAAAEHAVEAVESGMVVGLGAGTTAAHAVRRIGALLAGGRLRDVRGVACATAVERLAREVGIPLVTLREVAAIDVTIDGADEVDPALDLVKGAGGALLREKVVAQASRREIIVVDEAKLSARLGTQASVPVEVVAWAADAVARFVAGLGGRPVLRCVGGCAFLTDEGHPILDCTFGAIEDVAWLARRLEGRAGVVEHGLFLELASEVVVASATGTRVLRR